MDIGAIGRNKARDIYNLISEQFYQNKDKVHNGLVPMDMVLEYFNITKNLINNMWRSKYYGFRN